MGPALTAATAKPSVATSEANLMMGMLGSWRTTYLALDDRPLYIIGRARPGGAGGYSVVIAFTTSSVLYPTYSKTL
jgi:hypothetical protein